MDTNKHNYSDNTTDNNIYNALDNTMGNTMIINNSIDNMTDNIIPDSANGTDVSVVPGGVGGGRDGGGSSGNSNNGNNSNNGVTGNNCNNANTDNTTANTPANTADNAANATDTAATTPHTKPDYYKLADEHPELYRILKNGAVFDRKKCRIVAIDNSKNAHAITKETSQDMHKQRANLRLQAQISARSGIADHLNKPTALAAWADIVGSQAERAVDPEFARSTEAARFVGVATGFMADKGTAEAGRSGSGSTIINVFGDELAETLMRIAAEEAARRAGEGEGEVIEGEYREGGSSGSGTGSG